MSEGNNEDVVGFDRIDDRVTPLGHRHAANGAAGTPPHFRERDDSAAPRLYGICEEETVAWALTIE